MSKISKGDAGYIQQNNTEFTCGDCVFAKSLGGTAFGCALMETAGPISMQSGTCIEFIYGIRGTELPWISDKTKVELGYVENEYGFGCKRCSRMSIAKRDCSEVDKNSTGDTPGEIAVTTCCNLWDPDSKRAKMSTPRLFELIQLTDTGAGRMSADEYRKFKELGG